MLDKFTVLLPLSVNFKQLTAKYVSGNLDSNQVPEISYVAFEEGYDSPSLWILAGLEKNEDKYTVDKYLQLSLNELGIPMPEKFEATLQYANALAGEIINGNTDLIEGIKEIIRILDGYIFGSENIYFERVYGEYHNYEDLMESVIDWSKDKSNEELMNDIKMELYLELESWNKKITDYLKN